MVHIWQNHNGKVAIHFWVPWTKREIYQAMLRWAQPRRFSLRRLTDCPRLGWHETIPL